MGHLLGHGVRFGIVTDVMAAGEGIETMLSLRCVLPTLPMVAAVEFQRHPMRLHQNAFAWIFFAQQRRLVLVAGNDRIGVPEQSVRLKQNSE